MTGYLPVLSPLFSSLFWADLTNQIQRECFWVRHYAGKVRYTVEGWVERNMDRVPESFSSTLAASTSKVSEEKR